MSSVEETSSQRYKVELKQVMKSLDAGHQLKDKLAKIRPSATEREVDLIGEEETTVMTIPARKDARFVFKESITLKKEGMMTIPAQINVWEKEGNLLRSYVYAEDHLTFKEKEEKINKTKSKDSMLYNQIELVFNWRL